MKKLEKMANGELQAEISRIEKILDNSQSNYLTRDLNKYLRRLQAEQTKRINRGETLC